MSVVTCADERRRAAARASEFNGIDSVAVDGDQITVIFFGKAPEDLEAHNFRITGGRRIRDVEVVHVHLCVNDDPELEDRVRLTVNHPGDLSTYRLCVVEAGPDGKPGDEPFHGFDPRYACVDFTFEHSQVSEVDCATTDPCPPQAFPRPEIDYLAKDYASFRQLLLDRLSLTTPNWVERHVPDLGVMLVELLAYEGDRLSYFQDAVATEAYLDTARLRVSVRRHARLVDYPMHDGCAARAWVFLETSERLTLPAGDFRFLASEEVFEPVHREDVPLYPAHNRISLWTWGNHDCCLPVGATSATLVNDGLRLRPGDLLLLEEILGAKTGVAADADRSHRQVVRLVTVEAGRDELFGQDVLEVTWDRADALTFPFCVNARGGPDCADLEVGVARGNIVLVEHGRSIDFCGADPEHIPVPQAPPDETGCPDPPVFGCSAEVVHRPAYPPLTQRFNPALARSPVTQTVPFPTEVDVAHQQAKQLLGLPDRTKARLLVLWRKARHHRMSTEDIGFLTLLFGERTLRTAGLAHDARQALRFLLARFDVLLAAKLRRLAELVRRARAGYQLDPNDEGWEIGQTWGAEEGDALDPARAVFRGPASAAVHIDVRAALPALTVRVDDDVWTPRRDLLSDDPDDRHVVGEVEDDVLRLRFGRNAPEPGSELAVTYRVGNGIAGNVGAEAIDQIVFCTTDQGGIIRVRNPLPATGGTDPEPVSEVRQRAPNEWRHRILRAVTAQDYATLTGDVPGVARAAADLRWTGSWYEAQVALDPVGADVAPDFLLDEVREHLHPFRKIGHDLLVRTAHLVPVDLALAVEVEPERVAEHVRADLLRVLHAFFAPDNLTFGTPVRVSQIVATAAAVAGVRHVEVTRLRRLFAEPEGELDAGLLRLGPLEVAQLDDDPVRPENGRLTLTLVGGR
jgi:predicted phage baseplate assembly protein